jgi:hypothetical protein
VTALREELATELRKHQGFLGVRDSIQPDVWFRWCVCGWNGGTLATEELGNADHSYREHLADALLPAVEQATRQSAAKELREAAADWWKPGRPHRPVRDWLRDRAEAIDAEDGS